MGLATIIRKEKFRQAEFRVLILGLDNAGKSTVLDRWIRQVDPTVLSNKICPTFGFEIKTLHTKSSSNPENILENNSSLSLNFWDIGGQKSIRPFWRNYYEETDGIVWVIDSADLDRLDDCKRELESVLNADRLLGASLLILANKQDSPSALNLETIRDALGLDELDNKHHHWAVYGTSAVTGVNIIESLDWLIRELSSSRFG